MGFLASYIALWVAVLFLFFVAIGLLREVTQLRRSQRAATNLEQLRIGHTAPTFSLQEVYSGETLSSKIFFGRPTSLEFCTFGWVGRGSHPRPIRRLRCMFGAESDFRLFAKERQAIPLG